MTRAELIQQYLSRLDRRLAAEAVDRDRLLAELAAHLDDSVERFRARGLSPEAAARRALDECGTPDELATAIRDNDEKGQRMTTWSRWTGVAGIAVVPVAAVSAYAWSWIGFGLTVVLGGLAVAGLVASHWRAARGPMTAALALFVLSNVAASTAPAGQASVRSVGIPAFLLLAAVGVAAYGFLGARVLPAAGVGLALAGVTVLLGLNTALYVTGNEPPYLALAGGAAAVAGWVWMNAAAVARGSGRGEPTAA